MHELSFKGGVAEMLYVGETPWHKEGHRFDRPPAWGELMAVVDYDLEKRPYYAPTGPGGVMEASPDAFYVCRADGGAALGTVGAKYVPLPNREAFEVLRPLIDGGVMTVETAGVLRGGADAWLLGRWDLDRFGPTAREVFQQAGDEVLPFATVMANHSGRRAVLLGQTPIRVVCANTLGAAEVEAERSPARWATVRHTAGGKRRLAEEATRLFAGVVERYEAIARHYAALKAKYLTGDEFRALVLDPVASDPRERFGWDPAARMADAVVARFERRRERLADLWATGKGHTGEPTAWFALNAVAEALDHDRTLWPTRAGCWRTAQLLTGEYAAVKERVTDGLVQFALAG